MKGLLEKIVDFVIVNWSYIYECIIGGLEIVKLYGGRG